MEIVDWSLVLSSSEFVLSCKEHGLSGDILVVGLDDVLVVDDEGSGGM